MADDRIEVEREVDGRWIAEAPAIPGALAYGSSQQEARANCARLVESIREGKSDGRG